MKKSVDPLILSARKKLHAVLKESLFVTDENGVPSIADQNSKASVCFASNLFEQLNVAGGNRKCAQASGTEFENVIEQFLHNTFLEASLFRPGNWLIRRDKTHIDQFQQFVHLAEIQKAVSEDPSLAASIGKDYLIRPDIVILRKPEPDHIINETRQFVDSTSATLTGFREVNNPHEILHASISCKWTLRSDRAQNARSEGLNLVRNRKGRVPHIAVVTAEPLPNRIASLALGTGDIDFVYHIALHELKKSVDQSEYDDSKEMLSTMINGNRLRDISDLPFDLVI